METEYDWSHYSVALVLSVPGFKVCAMMSAEFNTVAHMVLVSEAWMNQDRGSHNVFLHGFREILRTGHTCQWWICLQSPLGGSSKSCEDFSPFSVEKWLSSKAVRGVHILVKRWMYFLYLVLHTNIMCVYCFFIFPHFPICSLFSVETTECSRYQNYETFYEKIWPPVEPAQGRR